MTSSRSETLVNILQTVAILCQENGCKELATYLFRCGNISVYCERHAKQEAGRMGIDLPISEHKPLHASGSSALSVVKTNSGMIAI